MWSESIPNLGPVEGDSDRSLIHRTVVGDVGEEWQPLDLAPARLIEMLGNHGLNVYQAEDGRRKADDWNGRRKTEATVGRKENQRRKGPQIWRVSPGAYEICPHSPGIRERRTKCRQSRD